MVSVLVDEGELDRDDSEDVVVDIVAVKFSRAENNIRRPTQLEYFRYLKGDYLSHRKLL
jgi:hypothetical protein